MSWRRVVRAQNAGMRLDLDLDIYGTFCSCTTCSYLAYGYKDCAAQVRKAPHLITRGAHGPEPTPQLGTVGQRSRVVARV